MMPGLVALGLALWAGATLVLSEVRWFARRPLVDRLRPYSPGGMGRGAPAGVFSVESFTQAVGPLARAVGQRLAQLVGVSEELSVRLARIHSPLGVTEVRVRQLGASVAGFGVAALVVLALRPAVPLALLLVVAGPALAFLVQEQRIAVASERWQRRLFLELPVVAEQLALLLSAGYSLTSALNRSAQRSSGACGADLRRVCARLRQGVSETEALREWAAVADVAALDRLVPVLALNRETSDLGRLMAEEARAIRRDVHRELIEAAERRSQQVWIPVTVATLVPGVIFMGIPFVEALQRFGG
ncbi:MAG: type II secretion system F family protein [Actinomycetota bacterium]|jgi:tight adherence protein C|nr:type II secretion system F family protein [Actinomycetota bacterium]